MRCWRLHCPRSLRHKADQRFVLAAAVWRPKTLRTAPTAQCGSIIQARQGSRRQRGHPPSTLTDTMMA
jgi:hypothetical protein